MPPSPASMRVPVLLMLAATMAMVMQLAWICDAATMPANPPRYDPLALKERYYQTNKDVITPAQCALFKRGQECRRGLEGCQKRDAAILDHIQIHRKTTTKTKLLCVSYTQEGDHTTKADAMALSWMHRCDGALVLSNATDPTIPTVAIPHTGPET